MTQSRSRVWPWVLAGTVVSLAVVGWFSVRRARDLVQRFPDGRWVAIRHVTSATNGSHAFWMAQGWRAWMIRQPLPSPIQKWVRSQSSRVVFGGDTNSLALWWTAGTNDAVCRFPLEAFGSPGWRIIGDDGWIYPEAIPGSAVDVNQTSLGFVDFESFPREQSSLTAQMVDPMTRKVLATFKVPNPYPVVRTQWVAAPVPALFRAGAVTVRLDGIDVRRIATETQPVPDLPFRFRPQFTLLPEVGGPDDWETTRVEMRDATGNRGEYLNPAAAAWKVSVEIYPKPLTRQTNEVLGRWEGLSLKVPKPGEWLPLRGAATLEGRAYPILGIGGRGRHVFTNGVYAGPAVSPDRGSEYSVSNDGRTTTVTLGGQTGMLFGWGWPPPPEGSRLILRVRDAQGRWHGISPRGTADPFRTFRLPEELEGTFEAELVLQRSVTAEFLAAPPKVQAAGL